MDDNLEVTLTGETITTDRQIPISDDLLKKLLAAAMNSPSTENAQPWHFVLVTHVDLLSDMAAIIPDATMAQQALAAIVVCGDPRHEKLADRWASDCAGAVQNLLQAAQGKGLAAVWSAIYPADELMAAFRRLLNLPDSIMPHTFVPLGYPAESSVRGMPGVEEEKVHYNGW
jgi:nitroreductase